MNATHYAPRQQGKGEQGEVCKFEKSGVNAARLDELPPGVEFPPRLRDRIFFDASRKQLLFRGFMFKTDYDQLRALGSNAAYMQALDELFRKSSYHAVAIDIGIDQVLDDGTGTFASRSGWESIWRWALLIAGALAAAGLLYWCLTHLR